MARKNKYLLDGTPNPEYKEYKHTQKPGDRHKPRTRAQHHGGKRGKKLSLYDRANFVAWDGEGITLEDGTHIYTLLANSRGHYIITPDGLTTEECLDFILQECTTYHNSIHVGFVFSYDTTMILNSLEYEPLREIAKDGFAWGTRWHNYQIKYRYKKELTIKKISTPEFKPRLKQDGKYEFVKNIESSARIWDVFGFFQSSFVKAAEEWLGKDWPTLQMIKEGKLHRGTFTAPQIESYILPYCLAEVEALEEIMHKLASYLKIMGDELLKWDVQGNPREPQEDDRQVSITRWDGAGAIAATMLKHYNAKQYMGHDVTPAQVTMAGEYAFFGGRIEILKYGHYVGKIPHYDINSAYPYAQSKFIPDLTHGTWQHYDLYPLDDNLPDFGLFRVEWELGNENDRDSLMPFYPFAYREIGDTVIFPARGHGWVHACELQSAQRHLSAYQAQYPSARITIKEAWVYFPDDLTFRPFGWMERLYKVRRGWKAQKIKAEKTLKLGINSGYGKLAQSLGYNPETKLKPPYHNIIMAGFITAKTRASLYDAAMQAPHDMLFFATDGIFSTTPIDVQTGNELGEWEYEEHDEIIIVQSGVYFHRTKDQWEIMCRGFDKGTISYEPILNAWKKNKRYTHFPSTRFVGLKSGTISNDTYTNRLRRWVSIHDEQTEKGKVIEGRKLSLSAFGTKRRDLTDARGNPIWTKKGNVKPCDRLIETLPEINFAGFKLSEQYKLPWERGPVEDELDDVPSEVYLREHDEAGEM